MSDGIVQSPFPANVLDVRLESFARTLWTALLNAPTSKTALIEAETDHSVTYDELLSRCEITARRLVIHGCRLRDVVAIFAPNTIDCVVFLLACIRIGAVPAMINSLLTTDELERMLTVSSASYLYTSPALHCKAVPAANVCKLKKVFVNGDNCNGCVDIDSYLSIDESHLLPTFETLNQRLDDPFVILFSSGTTGPQKPVMLSHRNFQYQLATSSKHPRFTMMCEDSVVFSPLSHIPGFGTTLLCLESSFTVYLMNKFSIDTLLRLLERGKAVRVCLVTPIAILLAKSSETSKYNLENLKDMLIGAAPAGAELEQLLQLRYPWIQIRQIYAATEHCGTISMTPIADEAGTHVHKFGSVGVPIPGVSIKVIDLKTSMSLGPRMQGEILVKSPSVMLGYANNSEATAAAITSDGWMHTGDIGYYDEDGYIYIVDRVKELIKYNAYQVAPAELESVLLSHDDVADAAVVGLPSVECGELPLAWVVRKPNATVTEIQLQQFVNDRVAPFKKLRGGVHFVTAIPKSASGKVLRREIRASLERGRL